MSPPTPHAQNIAAPTVIAPPSVVPPAYTYLPPPTAPQAPIPTVDQIMVPSPNISSNLPENDDIEFDQGMPSISTPDNSPMIASPMPVASSPTHGVPPLAGTMPLSTIPPTDTAHDRSRSRSDHGKSSYSPRPP